MTPDQIREYLKYYRDLGIETIYRAPISVSPLAPTPPLAPAPPLSSVQPPPPVIANRTAHRATQSPLLIPEVSVLPQPAVTLPALTPAADTLANIRQDIGDCKRCRLCEARNKIVFGDGNEKSPLVFVGEGPGADEDAQGIPFVGRAGQLLTQMIENTAAKEGIPLKRADVYICNVVKCRPPENRTPQPDEMEICGQFLYRQLMTIKPKAICVLGATAMKALLNTREGITKSRGHWQKWRDIPVMITYHPSYLLRQYNVEAKRQAWEDLKTLLHFVYD